MEGGGEEDRISQLPDPILQHIISFIDIKQAVETSILSTRWKYLWLSLSDLDFNFTGLAIRSGVNLKDWQAREDFFHRFTQFVDHFLSHRDSTSTIRKFHLSLDSRLLRADDSSFLERCVDYAVNHGVESFHLDELYYCNYILRLPDAFFACKTLRELSLIQFENGIYLPQGLCLPYLKTLHLEKSEFTSDCNEGFFVSRSSCKDPFSRFPKLEKLTLHGCRNNGLVIACPKLTNLEISHNYGLVVVEEISTPELTSFRFQGPLPLQCSKVNVPKLEEACLSINIRYSNIKGKWITSNCMRLLHQLGNAKIVTLSLDTIKALEADRGAIEQSPSPFPNMTCLKLKKVPRRREFSTVLRRVMNYLTEGRCLCGSDDDSLAVEFPEGVSVVDEDNSQDLFDQDNIDELQLEFFFEIQDEI